jgi:replication factor C large subunit
MGESKPTVRLEGLIGIPSAVAAAKAWAQGWIDGSLCRPLLITGPTGTGKTALAHALALEFGWSLFEFNASDFRDEQSVGRLLAHTSASRSLFGGMRLILIDDADSLSGAADRGGAAAMAGIVLASRQPIIITATDYYDRKISSIKTHCTEIELRRAHISTISSFLKREAKEKGIPISASDAEKIAQGASGDIRAALNDLLARNTSASREREKSIFEIMKAIFSSGNYAATRKAAFSSGVDHDTLKLWIAQNLPSTCPKPFELSEGYGWLSRSDIFDGRIKRSQYWGYLRYSSDLMASGAALSRQGGPSGYAPFSYPDYMRAMGSSKSARALRNSVLSKIARSCHCSVQQAKTYLYLYEAEAKKGGLGNCMFDEDELAFIMKKPAKKTTGGKRAKKA